MKMKNIIIIAALTAATVAATTAATAQESPHEFSLHVGGGVSTLNYKPAEGNAKLGFGGLAGLGYTFRFSEHWGVGTGVETALFNGRYSLSSLSDHYLRNDGTEDFDYRYTLTNYRDRQQAILLNIPLMLHFQTDIQWFDLAALRTFYAALGGKVGIPLSAKFNNSADKLTATAYYSRPDWTPDEPLFMGFGEFGGLSHKGSLALKTVFFASAEAGVRWQLNDKLILSTGLYVDYGVNSVRPSAAAPLIDYPASADYRPNSALTSTLADKPLADKLNLIAAGIKIGLVFGAPSDEEEKAKFRTLPTAPDGFMPAVEPQRKATDEQRLTEERLLAEQQRAEEQRLAAERLLAEQQRAEEQRLAAERLLAEQQSAAEQRLAAAKEKIEQPIDGYPLNGTALSAGQKSMLDEKVALLLQLPLDVRIVIEGHTCDIGTHAANVLVGQKRADVVKNYLVQKGIAASLITTVSKAETQPLVPNSSVANRKKNRRVVVVVAD